MTFLLNSDNPNSTEGTVSNVVDTAADYAKDLVDRGTDYFKNAATNFVGNIFNRR